MIEKISKATTDLSGLISVLADNLYSTPEVVIRELVQNGHDAITRRRVESSDAETTPRINVTVHGSTKTLEITDNGSGLTYDEIETYLATIANGYTRKLRQSESHEDLIGFFGLGFLSAYVVSEKVDVFTCSYQSPDKAWQFTSRDARTYTIVPAEAQPVGTTVRLTLKDKFSYLADFADVEDILRYYCGLLTIPIHLNDMPEPVNAVDVPWLNTDRHPIQQQKELMAFCQQFSNGFDPVYAIEIPPGCSVSGILWVHDSGTYGTSDNRRLSVYLRGMLLCENDRQLLPPWAGFISAIINSTGLTPTASREALKKDEHYRQAQEEIHSALVNGLLEAATDKSDVWRQIARRHNEALRGAALADDDLFDALCDRISLPTNKGDRLIADLCDQSDGRIYLSMGDEGSAEEILFQSLNIPVARGFRYAVMRFCNQYAARKSLSVVTLGGTDNEDAVFSLRDKGPDSDHLIDLFVDPEREVGVLAEFEPPFMPIVKIPDRKAILKNEIEADDADKRLSNAVLALARSTVKKIENTKVIRVYINLRSPIISRLQALPEPQRTKCAAMIRAFFDIPLYGEERAYSPETSPYQTFFENLLDMMGTEDGSMGLGE